MRGPVLWLAALLVVGCGREVMEAASLAELVAHQDRYDDRLVATEGELHVYPTPRHYWIEDEALHRVEVLGAADLDLRVGQWLRVEGRFHWDPESGRRIEVHRLQRRRAGPDPP